ncbi:MAG: 30S ribosomal protein S17 [Caldisericaceae bacterium]
MARKELVGEVVSSYQKTVVVKVTNLVSHPLYRKQTKQFTKVYAEDVEGKVKPGDIVKVVETRPLSKLKRWKVTEIISGGAE